MSKEIRARNVRVGMTIETGGTRRSQWRPGALLVASIGGYEKSDANGPHDGLVFNDASGRRIYRWPDNLVTLLAPSPDKTGDN